ncbi:MAG: hypothetical protein K6T88_14995 [Bacillus sp. (in: Bacteria)]|nr:hypothetical protein [Bacillus sp. (in: firmicutes)]
MAIKKQIENQLVDTMYENIQYFYRIAKRILLIEEDVEDAWTAMIYQKFLWTLITIG